MLVVGAMIVPMIVACPWPCLDHSIAALTKLTSRPRTATRIAWSKAIGSGCTRRVTDSQAIMMAATARMMPLL